MFQKLPSTYVDSNFQLKFSSSGTTTPPEIDPNYEYAVDIPLKNINRKVLSVPTTQCGKRTVWLSPGSTMRQSTYFPAHTMGSTSVDRSSLPNTLTNILAAQRQSLYIEEHSGIGHTTAHSYHQLSSQPLLGRSETYHDEVTNQQQSNDQSHLSRV